MAKVAPVLAFMLVLAVVVEGRDWRFESVKRVKRGYNPGGLSHGDQFGRSDEHNASGSKERLGCSEEQGGGRLVAEQEMQHYGSSSHELSYNKDNRPRHRSFSKSSASASASAVAFNQNHKANL